MCQPVWRILGCVIRQYSLYMTGGRDGKRGREERCRRAFECGGRNCNAGFLSLISCVYASMSVFIPIMWLFMCFSSSVSPVCCFRACVCVCVCDGGRGPVAGRKWPGPFHLTPLRLQTNYLRPLRTPIIHSREQAIFIIDWWETPAEKDRQREQGGVRETKWKTKREQWGEIKSSKEGRSGRGSKALARKRGWIKGRENRLQVKKGGWGERSKR